MNKNALHKRTQYVLQAHSMYYKHAIPIHVAHLNMYIKNIKDAFVMCISDLLRLFFKYKKNITMPQKELLTIFDEVKGKIE